MATAIGGSGASGKHYGGCGGNHDDRSEAGITALFAASRSGGVGAAGAEINHAALLPFVKNKKRSDGHECETGGIVPLELVA